MSRSLQYPTLTPRKIPSQPRAAETVAAIIEAAAQVLETRGLEGFNTNAIARRAGVSIGSLYQYFPGKNALTIALMRREATQFYDDAAAALEEPTAEAALDYLISAAVRQQLQRPTLARLLDVEESRATFRQEMTSPGIFQTLLVKVVERSDMPRQKHSDIAAGDVYAMIRGMVDAAGERGESDVADLKRRVRAAVFGYLSGTASAD
jgi:AcrR family transcriptional regulator